MCLPLLRLKPHQTLPCHVTRWTLARERTKHAHVRMPATHKHCRCVQIKKGYNFIKYIWAVHISKWCSIIKSSREPDNALMFVKNYISNTSPVIRHYLLIGLSPPAVWISNTGHCVCPGPGVLTYRSCLSERTVQSGLQHQNSGRPDSCPCPAQYGWGDPENTSEK